MEKIILKLEGSGDFFTQEAYKTLRTNLQFCGQDIRVVAITSCHENEGKTTVTLNLARSLAELGKRVLVIDADMRKSVIAGRHTNVKNPIGLSEVLTGMAALDDSIYTTSRPEVHMIFSGKYPPNPVELLSGKYFTALINGTRKIYDYVLIDTPPLGQVIDAAVVAANCDGVILVMSDNTVRSKQAQEVVGQLRKTDTKILGVVRNNANTKNKPYYGKNKPYARSNKKA